MSERPFYCLPCDVPMKLYAALTRKDLPELRPALVADAFFVFHIVLAESHRAKPNYFFEIENGDATHAVKLAIGKTDFLLRTWTPQRIDPALQVLHSRGFLMPHSASGKEWLKIVEPWQHVPLTKKYAKAESPPSASDPPEQGSLKLDGGMAVLPPPKSRIRIEENQESESKARAPGGDDSGSRALSSGGESGCFARDEDSSDDEVWQDFVKLMRRRNTGVKELVERGARFQCMLRGQRRAFAHAVSALKAKTEAEFAKVENIGAAFVWEFKRNGGSEKQRA
jgi:hypothetical protein